MEWCNRGSLRFFACLVGLTAFFLVVQLVVPPLVYGNDAQSECDDRWGIVQPPVLDQLPEQPSYAYDELQSPPRHEKYNPASREEERQAHEHDVGVAPAAPYWRVPSNHIPQLPRAHSGLYYMHVGKAWGKSFAQALQQIKCERRSACCNVCLKSSHWHLAEHVKHPETQSMESIPVVWTMRHPITRAISHYYYSQASKWASTWQFGAEALSLCEIMADGDLAAIASTTWLDGTAGVYYWAGMHPEEYVRPSFAAQEWQEVVGMVNGNRSAILRRAVENLHRYSVWNGVVEMFEELLPVLFYRTDVSASSFEMPHLNSDRVKRVKPDCPASDERMLAQLRQLMPMDMWFYEYVKSVAEAELRSYDLAMNGADLSAIGSAEWPAVRYPTEEELGGCRLHIDEHRALPEKRAKKNPQAGYDLGDVPIDIVCDGKVWGHREPGQTWKNNVND